MRPRCSSATTHGAAGTTCSPRCRDRDGRRQHRRLEARRPRAVVDRDRPPRGLRGLHRGDARRHRLRPARVQRVSVVHGHRRQRGAHLLRVSRLQRDHLRRRRPSRPRARVAARDVLRARGDDGALRPHLARGVRHAHRRSGDRVRRDRDRRGGEARARRRRLHDDGDRRAARDASSVNATLYARAG